MTLASEGVDANVESLGGPPKDVVPSEPEGEENGEYDMEHSLLQEERMRAYFAADAEAPAAAAAAQAACVISAATGQEITLPEDVLAGKVPYKCAFRVYRINPKPYYSVQTLEERLPMLGAASVDQLCKTIVMENTKHSGDLLSVLIKSHFCD
ncbi:prolyl-tRNA synthetases associated domain-containing protein [Cyclospora cayetanensis]|uniref:Prolyl-tRNA synthetases associated domain-containing protein n=1 Tax=Cyclospora cayetanensis TaxID=88456 RepID=A0A1D3D2G5_9EIME|nr:prolyl-tRNA synthetases associated domain-containing protein [Cyclospora cayetanensis]